MRVSELSVRSGVPVPTIKYYVRAGLLPRGEVTSATQASYGEEHVRRLRLIRALSDVGELQLADVRRVLDAVDRPSIGIHDLLGSLSWAIVPPVEAPADDDEWRAARETVDELLAGLDWRVYPDAPARDVLAQTVLALRRAGLPEPARWLRQYARLAHETATVDVDQLDADAPRAELVEHALLGTVLYERGFGALRRLAQEDVSARRYGRGTRTGDEGG